MLDAIFQNPLQQVLSKYRPQVNQINALENNFKQFTDFELRAKTDELRNRLLKGEPKVNLIPEAFAA